MMQYYIFTNQKQKGPFGLREVIKLVKPETLVWHDGLPTWQKAETLPEIISALPASPLVKNTLSYPPPLSPGEEYNFYDTTAQVKTFTASTVVIYILFGLLLFISVVAFTNYFTKKSLHNHQIESVFLEPQMHTNK